MVSVVKFRSMDEILKVLIAIQNLDGEIEKLRHKKISLPKEIQELENEIQKLSAEKEKIIASFKKEEIKLRELEVDLKEIQEKIRNFQEKSRQVKSNEEYRAMISQIEHANMEKLKKEEEIVVQMELVEKLQRELPEKTKSLDEKKQELEKAANISKQQLAEIEEQLKWNEEKKKVLLEKLPDKERQLYLKLQSRFGSYAICKVLENDMPKAEKDYVCSGCYSVLPLSFVQELKSKHTYSRCPNCGRIIYYHEEM